MMLEKSLITAAWAEVEILAAGDANALAIVATNAFAIDFEVDGFEQNRVEIDRIVLVGDGMEVVFFEDDFVGVADAPRIDEFEDGMEFEFAFESFATTVARELEICTDVGVEVDELCVCKELGIVLNGAKHGAFVGIVEILDEVLGGDFASRDKRLFVAYIIDVNPHSTNLQSTCASFKRKKTPISGGRNIGMCTVRVKRFVF